MHATIPEKELMAVYVDELGAGGHAPNWLCHMMADTDEELYEMAARIGIPRRWLHLAGTPYIRYDITRLMRMRAILLGAREITTRQAEALWTKKRLAMLAVYDRKLPEVDPAGE